jgi:hypothetical protein
LKSTGATGLLALFAIGVLASQFLANFLMSQRPRR